MSTRQGMHQAFVSFKDDIADFEAPENPAELSSWQKLKVGNSHALRAIANEGMVWVKNPLSAGSDLAKGMVVNTWTTLRHPVQTFEAVGTTYQHDKVEGVIHGAKMAGSVHEGFHGFQQYMMEVLLSGDENTSFGEVFDEHVYSWADNNYRTGYASQSNNASQRVLGIPADRLSEATGIYDFILERELFPGLDSYAEYESQPVETGAWRMGNQFEAAHKTLNPLPEGP